MVFEGKVEMSYPTYYISSSIVAVDTRTESKIIMLPPALETLEIKPLVILDRTGNASVNNIYLSTQIDNLMDNRLSTIVMSIDFQSLQIIPYSTTRYAITTNYTQGLSPFLYAIQIVTQFFDIPTAESWVTVAVSPDGTYLLAVASGGSNDGFYTSINNGISFSRYYERQDSFIASAMGSTYWFVLTSGILYRSTDQGVRWDFFSLPRQDILAIACNKIGDYVIVVSSGFLYYSFDAGATFERVNTLNTGEASITNCAIGDAPSISQDDIVVYITTQDSGSSDGYIYVTNNLTEGNPFYPYGPSKNWRCVSCNLAGDIAYALTDFYELYKSTDTGQTWTLLTTPPANFLNIQIPCSSDGLVFFGFELTGSGLQRYLTQDGGTTFSPVGDLLPGNLAQYGLSSDGRTSLFADPSVQLSVGRTIVR